MVHLWKERFLVGAYHKLYAKRISPCGIICKINDKAYVVEFPKELQISKTFNIADLSTYYPPGEAVV